MLSSLARSWIRNSAVDYEIHCASSA